MQESGTLQLHHHKGFLGNTVATSATSGFQIHQKKVGSRLNLYVAHQVNLYKKNKLRLKLKLELANKLSRSVYVSPGPGVSLLPHIWVR